MSDVDAVLLLLLLLFLPFETSEKVKGIGMHKPEGEKVKIEEMKNISFCIASRVA